MKNKYFGTDGIRGTVNQGNITGEKFFKFGLASGTYFKNLKKYCSGSTVFFITHRLTTIQNADLILMLDKGIIAETGDHKKLMSNNGRYFALYQQQGQS